MPNIYKGDIGFTGQQANLIDKNNIGADLNYSMSSGNLLLTNDRTGEMFSYEDEPDKLETASAGRLKVSEPALHCPTCASRMISYVRGKRKISIPFCPIHGHESLTQYSNLSCNAFRNDAVRHFDAEEFGAELTGSEFYPVGQGRIIGAVTGDSQFSPLGANAEEDVKRERRMKSKRRTRNRTRARMMKMKNRGMKGTMAAEYNSLYGERQTTQFGLVGGGNDFAQNRAESMSGRSMWLVTAMAAIGFVSGIAFKDMRKDTDSE